MPGKESKYPDIIFRVGQGLYCINGQYVISIGKLPKYHSVPRALEGVNGIIRFREEVVPVVDMAAVFGDDGTQTAADNWDNPAPKTGTSADMMIIIKNAHSQIGLIVDEVLMIEMLERVRDEAEGLSFEHSRYIKAVKQRADTDEIILEIEAEELFQKFGEIPESILKEDANYTESEEAHNGRK